MSITLVSYQLNVVQIRYSFPNLLTLDISYNYLTNLSSVIASLIDMPALRVLFVKGNPMTLTRSYVDRFKEELVGLKMLDGQNLGKETEEGTTRQVNDINQLMNTLYSE